MLGKFENFRDDAAPCERMCEKIWIFQSQTKRQADLSRRLADVGIVDNECFCQELAPETINSSDDAEREEHGGTYDSP